MPQNLSDLAIFLPKAKKNVHNATAISKVGQKQYITSILFNAYSLGLPSNFDFKGSKS